MTAITFKKGDRVKVKSWKSMQRDYRSDIYDSIDFGSMVFSENMRRFCGQTGTIIKVKDSYRIIFDGKKRKAQYYFCDEMLSRVKRKQNRFKLKKIMKKLNRHYKYNKDLL